MQKMSLPTHCNHLASEEFGQWVRQQPPAHHFLVLLSSMAGRMLAALEAHRQQRPWLSRFLTLQSLRVALYHELCQTWSRKLVRAGVVELHMARTQGVLRAEGSAERFAEFIDLLSMSTYQVGFFEKYPVLATQLAMYEEQAVVAWIDLFTHLEHSWPMLENYFFAAAEIKAGIFFDTLQRSGDIHAKWRSVVVLTCRVRQRQVKIVYKPRSLLIDQAFYAALAWLNKRSDFNFYLPKLVLGEGYGFYEYIEHRPCQTIEEIKTYYQRLGGLLMVVHGCLGSDIHAENIIAMGSQPVIIDLECLLPPTFVNNDLTAVAQNLLEVGILPRQAFVSTGYAGLDISAFGAMSKQVLKQTVLRAVRAGHDDMTIVRVNESLVREFPLPLFHGESVYALDFAEVFKQGSAIALATIENALEDYVLLLHRSFQHAVVRLVFRHTNEYMVLVQESYHPKLLMNADDFAEHFSWLRAQAHDGMSGLIAHERMDLHAGLIPAFYCDVSARAVMDARGQLVPIRLAACSVVRWESHVRAIFNSKRWMSKLLMIEQAFCVYRLNREHIGLGDQQAVSQQRLHFYLQKMIDEHLLFYSSEKNRVSWSAVARIEKNVWRVNWLQGANFGSDLMGVAVWFAALLDYPQLSSTQRHLLMELLQKIFCTIKDSISQIQSEDIGLFVGWGGLIYGLERCRAYWQTDDYDETLEAWLLQYHQALSVTKHADVLQGLAGGLMVLLSMPLTSSLHRECITRSVQRLLALYPDPSKLPLQLSVAYTRPLLGYSHGTSGMVVALWHYYLRHRDVIVWRWIRKALRYERASYSVLQQNWPDFRAQAVADNKIYSTVAWCHGAAGVLLSRLQLYKAGYRDGQIAREIKMGLAILLERGFTGVLNICHGDMGNLDILLLAAQQGWVSREVYAEKLHRVLDHLSRPDAITEPGITVFSAGLLTGRTGIGYQLLRCLYPEKVSSVLAVL